LLDDFNVLMNPVVRWTIQLAARLQAFERGLSLQLATVLVSWRLGVASGTIYRKNNQPGRKRYSNPPSVRLLN
jgi:hypothetical protein